LNEPFTFLITGAAGSIGQLFAKTLLAFDSKIIIIGLDNDDTELYKVSEQLKTTGRFKPILADISCSNELEEVFESFHIDYVIHTAAHKQVSLLEDFPDRAFKINALASIQLFKIAAKNSCATLFISSDKSVEPIGVLGMSKFIPEFVIAHNFPDVSVLRLPNIIGSRGSFFSEWLDIYQKKGFIPVTEITTKRHIIHLEELSTIIIDWYIHHQNKLQHVFIPQSTDEINVYAFIKEQLEVHQIDESVIRLTGLRSGEKEAEALYWPHEQFSSTQNCSLLYSKLTFPTQTWIQTDRVVNLSEKNLKTVFYTCLKTLKHQFQRK
jgi:FlaA1/EpsC-like NDP-sugar epimerase